MFAGKVIAISRLAGKSGLKEDRAMSVQKCARHIIQATRARKRELVMTLRGKIGLWLKLAFPEVVDRMLFDAVVKERGEN